MKKLNLKSKKGSARTCFRGGFTLLEALVAISILMVAVMAPITIAQKGLSSAIYSKNQMIASYLAQDAIEYIINQRDNSSINKDSDWAGFLVAFSKCLDGKNCQIDTNVDNGNGRIYDSKGNLSKDPNGFYGYEPGGTPTNFTRQINIVRNISNEDEALITVTVGWGTDSVTVKTLIYNY